MPFGIAAAVAAPLVGAGISAALSPGQSQSAASQFNPQLTQIANSGTAAANVDSQTSASQLAWAQGLYGSTQGAAQNYLSNLTGNATATGTLGGIASTAGVGGAAGTLAAGQTEEGVAQTNANNLYGEATAYGSTANADRLAGQAQADVATASNAARANATQQLESYGIDPSQTRYGALDLGSQITQAAATAGAGTASRQNTFNTAQALKTSALAGQEASVGADTSLTGAGSQLGSVGTGLYGSSAAASSQGINDQDSRTSTFGNLEGTPIQYAQASTSALGNASNALSGASSNQTTSYNEQNQSSQGLASGLGSAIGGGLQYASQNGYLGGSGSSNSFNSQDFD